MIVTAALAALGGVIAAFLVRNPEAVPEVEPTPAPTGWFCGVEGPPIDTCPGSTAGRAPSERAA
jgi:hypothetical protein